MPKPSLFCAALDDIYQAPTWVGALGGDAPLGKDDLRVSLGLAAVFGHTLTSSARLVIDNLALIELSELPEWRAVIMEVIRPAAGAPDWDTFLNRCGGTEDNAPLFMTSYGGRFNPEIVEAWKGGRGSHDSQRLFRERYPAARDFIDRLKVAGVTPVALHAEPGAYRLHLANQLKSASAPHVVLAELSSCDTRGAALTYLLAAREALPDDSFRVLVACAVDAKHDEIMNQLGVSSFARPSGVSTAGVRPEITQAELPTLGGVLNGRFGASAVQAILNAPSVRKHQEQLWAPHLRHSATFQDSLERLCMEVSVVVGERNADQNASLAVQFGGTALATSVALPYPWDLAFGVVGGLVTVSGVTRRGTKLWRHLHCDRSLYRELVNWGTSHGA